MIAPTKSDSQNPKATYSWLRATAMQAVLTAALLLVAWRGEGKSWGAYAQVMALLGIVATWSLALRTIRARLIELFNFWGRASMNLRPAYKAYVKSSVRRLRIIAAGITIPFFVMPLLYTILCTFLAVHSTTHGADYWLPPAMGMLLAALIVAGYFHWSIVPLPVAVPVRVAVRHYRRRAR